MFKKLAFSIRAIIISLSSFFLLLVTSVSIGILANFFNHDFYSSTKEEVELETTNFELTMELLDGSILNVVTDEDLINYLQTQDINAQTKTRTAINALVDSTPVFLGATLYKNGVDSAVIYSSAIGGPARFSAVQAVPKFAQFIADPTTHAIFSIHDQAIANTYALQSYDKSLAMLSGLYLIYDSNEINIIGYLCIDFSTHEISNYFDVTDYKFFANSTVLLSNENTYLKVNNQEDLSIYLQAEYSTQPIKFSSKEFSIKTSILEQFDFTVIIPMINAYHPIIITTIIVFACDIIFLTLSIIIANLLANHVRQPLVKLYKKMTDETVIDTQHNQDINQ